MRAGCYDFCNCRRSFSNICPRLRVAMEETGSGYGDWIREELIFLIRAFRIERRAEDPGFLGGFIDIRIN
jgi:hypothetical protein